MTKQYVTLDPEAFVRYFEEHWKELEEADGYIREVLPTIRGKLNATKRYLAKRRKRNPDIYDIHLQQTAAIRMANQLIATALQNLEQKATNPPARKPQRT
jgi:hypothetical protein